jgi:hypothetical protein
MVRDGVQRRKIGYQAWSEPDVVEFVESWSPRIRGWFVVFTDHKLMPFYERELENAGRLVFASLPYVEPGMTVRRQGDGHSSWTSYVIAARPRTREFLRWGTLRGAYILPPGHKEKRLIMGQKTQWVMREVIKDHSRSGDLIVDPCCGSGSTLVAAVGLGRNALGADGDQRAIDIVRTRLPNGMRADGGRSRVRQEVVGGGFASRSVLGDVGG